MSALYLYINLAVLAVPLALSFDRRVAFFRLWPYVLPAIAINAAIFIAWDALFTERGIWGFNPDYLEIRRRADLARPATGERQLVILAAAWLGRVRLIDNLTVG